MSNGESEAVNVRGLAMNGSEVIESEVDIGGWDGVASVFEHLQYSPPREMVPVTLSASLVHIPTQTRPQWLLIHLHSRPIGLHACPTHSLTLFL